MNDISLAIYNRATDESTESQALQDAIEDFAYKKVNNPTFPYLTYQFITGTPQYNFTNTLENTLYQFDIWGKKSTDVTEIADKVKAVFDNTSLDVDGYNHVVCRREAYRELYESDTEIFHYIIEYRIQVD